MGESYEIDNLQFAQSAEAAGETAAAARFEEIRGDEMGHRDAFEIAGTVEIVKGDFRCAVVRRRWRLFTPLLRIPEGLPLQQLAQEFRLE